MKATLKFNLPEEKEEYNMAIRGGDFCSVLWDFAEYLRKEKKKDIEPKYSAQELLDDIINNFWEILNNHNVEL